MGVTKEVLVPGSGPKPQPKQMVACHYVGTLADGTVFDSSRSRNKPLNFLVGIGQVIKGWDEGIADMQLGEKAKLVCSPDYAYGPQGFPPKIPANATLTFEVELLQIGDEKAGGGSWCTIL